jgi:polyhydroxybutyrate depolymerase
MLAPRRARTATIIALALAGPACLRATRPMTGTNQRRLIVGGVTRTYLVHADGEAKPRRPVILVLHGWRGTAADIERRTKGTFNKLADREGAVVVYPQALGDPRWNDGWPVPPGAEPPPDDVAFLSALVDAVAAEFGIDRQRVFAAGLSNGASMVYRLACQRPDLVAAVAPVSGNMSQSVASACADPTPVSIITMHGTDDPIVPFTSAIRNDIVTWVRRDRCPPQATSSSLPDVDPTDGTRTRLDVFGPCAAGTEVASYTIEGGGHAWPGGESVRGFVRRGNTPRDFDAGEVMWEFFMKHPRR